MLRAYLLDDIPGVVLIDDVSSKEIEVLFRLLVTEPSTSESASLDNADHS